MAARAVPANPEPRRRTNKVLAVAFIGSISKIVRPVLHERLGAELVPFNEINVA
jgi:hypothetical protein